MSTIQLKSEAKSEKRERLKITDSKSPVSVIRSSLFVLVCFLHCTRQDSTLKTYFSSCLKAAPPPPHHLDSENSICVKYYITRVRGYCVLRKLPGSVLLKHKHSQDETQIFDFLFDNQCQQSLHNLCS